MTHPIKKLPEVCVAPARMMPWALVAVVALTACASARYDPSTFAGQVACSMASDRVRARCERRHIRSGALTYGVPSTVVREYRGDVLEVAYVELPFRVSAQLIAEMVQGHSLDERYLAGYCRHHVLEQAPSRTTAQDRCYCSAFCGNPTAFDKFDCGASADYEMYRKNISNWLSGFQPLPSCDAPSGDRLDPNDIEAGEPPGGVLMLMFE